MRSAIEGLAAGAEQLVLLGAGYDSRPYRLPQAAGVRVFEVDHPTTQEVEQRRLARMLGSPPANVTFVAVDFIRQDLGGVLVSSGYDPGKRTFFIWEG